MDKKRMSNRKKPPLDLECLSKRKYAVIATTTEFAIYRPYAFDSAIHLLNQARADLLKARPAFSHSDVIVEFPPQVSLSLVVPATPQGALRIDNGDEAPYRDDEAPRGEARHSQKSTSLEESALDEAERLARAAADISMRAIDVGNATADRASKTPMSIEDVTLQLAQSPDEQVSRNIHVRARGPERDITFASGKKTVGGGKQISAFAYSTETFVLKACTVSPSNRPGFLQLTGSPSDLGWIQLKERYADVPLLFVDDEGPEMQTLKYGAVNRLSVDIEICVAERVDSRRQYLFPLRILNPTAVLSQVSERLALLVDTFS